MNRNGKILKTLAANVEWDMLDDVMHFHNKGNINLDSTFYKKVSPHSLTLEQLQSLERGDYEISCFHDDAISCDVECDTQRRMRSATKFSDKKINFEIIKRLLQQVFHQKSDGSRAYPSGGALYPVEVICVVFSDRVKHSPESGLYHYRPTLNVLQCLQKLPNDTLRDTLYRHDLPDTRQPNFALIYVGLLGKMLVKYRYRGYRYAFIEAGCMVQQADTMAEKLELRNKLYSGFNDNELVKLLGLDPLQFMPIVIQSFGKSL